MSTYKFKINLSKNYQGPTSAGRGLLIEEENLHPKADIYKDGPRELIILGSPIYRDKINNKAIASKIFEEGVNGSSVRAFDGSFLFVLYDERKISLTVVNDRFASIPFYYYFSDKRGFIGSVNYSDIWNELVKRGDFSLNEEAFYEFIHLQRLLGDKTYDRNTRYLNSASILRFDANGGTLNLDRYWRPSFKKVHRTEKDASRLLADLTADSISERTSDGKRYGLLLSGGLDSRLVLAGFKRPVECVTIGPYENNEYFVAKELAGAKGYPHTFKKRQNSHYADILEDAVFLGGAMNMYSHGHFLNLEEELRPKADLFFHGHGFDYMFQGKYLAYEEVGIFGKRTYMKRMMDIEGDIKKMFLNKISYRMKSIDPLSLVTDREKGKIEESIYSSVDEIMEEGKDCCNNAYDLWEYLIMHNLSRHYTFLNISSIRTIAEERTPAFDNQLFDFYLSLPIEDRLNRAIFVNAIKALDERLYKIRNANTNFNIYDSDFILTAKLAVNKTLKKFGFKVLLPPAQKERSWPVKRDIISKNSKMGEAAKALIGSWALEKLRFLDMDKIRFYVEEDLEARADYSDIILSLITVDTFMKLGETVCSPLKK